MVSNVRATEGDCGEVERHHQGKKADGPGPHHQLHTCRSVHNEQVSQKAANGNKTVHSHDCQKGALCCPINREMYISARHNL